MHNFMRRNGDKIKFSWVQAIRGKSEMPVGCRRKSDRTTPRAKVCGRAQERAGLTTSFDGINERLAIRSCTEAPFFTSTEFPCIQWTSTCKDQNFIGWNNQVVAGSISTGRWIEELGRPLINPSWSNCRQLIGKLADDGVRCELKAVSSFLATKKT